MLPLFSKVPFFTATNQKPFFIVIRYLLIKQLGWAEYFSLLAVMLGEKKQCDSRNVLWFMEKYVSYICIVTIEIEFDSVGFCILLHYTIVYGQTSS